MPADGFYRTTDEGIVFIEPEAIDLDGDLQYWVELCLDYNPKAKSTKKR
jgi:hypothetical protein